MFDFECQLRELGRVVVPAMFAAHRDDAIARIGEDIALQIVQNAIAIHVVVRYRNIVGIRSYEDLQELFVALCIQLRVESFHRDCGPVSWTEL